MLYVLLKIEKRLKKIDVSLCSKFNSDIQHTVTSDGSLEVYLKKYRSAPLFCSTSDITVTDLSTRGNWIDFSFFLFKLGFLNGVVENWKTVWIKKKSCYIFILLRNMMSHSAPNQISQLQRKICKISLFFQTGLGKS